MTDIAECSLESAESQFLSPISLSPPDVEEKPETTAELIATSDSKALKRQKIITEIMNTEQTYVGILQEIQNTFLIPLKFADAKGAPILTGKTISDVFSNFDSILQINERLLIDLTNDVDANSVGSIFCTYIPLFKFYSIYVSNFERSSDVLAEQIEKNKVFEEFLAKEGKTTGGVNLQGMLLCPVQRIPRYKLLLEDLKKNTEEYHEDYENLTQAISMIQEGIHLTKSNFSNALVAVYVNNKIKEQNNLFKMFEIQKTLVGFPEPLIVHHRKFKRSGTLIKVCRKTNKPRIFYLFSDMLIYGTPNPTGTVTFHRKIPLHSTTLLDLKTSENEDENAFQITSEQKSFTVIAANRVEKRSWMIDIDLAIHEHNQVRSFAFVAPIWIPDNSSHCCLVCRSQFNVIRRRHHCRRCGTLVCNACSKRKLELQNRQIARVCDNCMSELIKDKE